MRHTLSPQLQLGECDISAIEFDAYSRDDIPQLLCGLQHLYDDKECRNVVLELMKENVLEMVDADTGRPGMSLWAVLVLGVVRSGLNCDYDRVMELANEHNTLRQMLGHGLLDEQKRYGLQTIKDNVSKLTPEIIDLINWLIVNQGHHLLGQDGQSLRGRCDSSVVKTDVHYPTDANLLMDAMRKILRACGKAGGIFASIEGWRQYEHLYQRLRNLYHKVRKLKKSTSKNPATVQARLEVIATSWQALRDLCERLLKRAAGTLTQLRTIINPAALSFAEDIECFQAHAERQIDQIHRRVIDSEVIPHREKVFSLFEEHTEWIVKGKAGVPVELGLRVCILEDQMGFILHHRVMQQETDDKVTVRMIRETQVRYPMLHACSFDKGYYTPDNRVRLESLLEQVTLPKKGRWSEADRVRESDEDFVAARKQHSAVESAINALQVHGLDKCPDHGIEGFKRYVALGVLGRNLIKIGAVLQHREHERLRRLAA
ncbi:MAG: ISNCY family transposase [Sedimenticola sp.]